MLYALIFILILFAVVFYLEKANSTETGSTPLEKDYTTAKSFVEKEKSTILDLEAQSFETGEQKQRLLDAKERIHNFEPPKSFSGLHNELFIKYKNGMIQAIDNQLQKPTVDFAALEKEIGQAVAFWTVLEMYILEDLHLYNK